MKKGRIIEIAFLHALSATGYVGLVASLIMFVDSGIPDGSASPTLFFLGMLLLFSASAATMFSLVFLRPILWYLEGKKKEAVILFATTVGFLVLSAFTALLFAIFSVV